MPSSVIGAVVAAAVTGPGMVFGLQTSLFFATLARGAIPRCLSGYVTAVPSRG